MTSTTGSTEAEPLPWLPGRVLELILSPATLYDRLREDPVWFSALLVGAVLAMVATLLLPIELFEETLRRQIIESGGVLPDNFRLPGLYRWALVAGGVLGWFIVVTVVSSLVTVLYAFVLGDEGTFSQYLAVTAHAFLVPALAGLILIPLKIYSGDIRLTLSLGSFAFFLGDGYLYRVLSLLDLFGLWAYSLIALGASRIDTRRGWGGDAVAIMFIPLGFALIFGIFSF